MEREVRPMYVGSCGHRIDGEDDAHTMRDQLRSGEECVRKKRRLREGCLQLLDQTLALTKDIHITLGRLLSAWPTNLENLCCHVEMRSPRNVGKRRVSEVLTKGGGGVMELSINSNHLYRRKRQRVKTERSKTKPNHRQDSKRKQKETQPNKARGRTHRQKQAQAKEERRIRGLTEDPPNSRQTKDNRRRRNHASSARHRFTIDVILKIGKRSYPSASVCWWSERILKWAWCIEKEATWVVSQAPEQKQGKRESSRWTLINLGRADDTARHLVYIF
jgi:hypothetical protein